MKEPRPLPAPVLKAAAGVLNSVLAVDPAALRQLGELAGRSVTVEIGDLGLVVAVVVAADRLELGAPAGTPDATVSGSIASLLAAARSGTPKGLAVSGDAELVHGLARTMARLPAAAWERLARTVGDVPARGLERLSRALLASLGDARERFAASLGEYLQHEARVVVPRAELDDFLAAVDRLRTDGDRLEKRIERLERRGGR